MYQKSIVIFFVLFIFLFCTQICFAHINNPYNPNLLLIFLTYALYQHQPLWQCITILLGIEFISLLQLGASGYNVIILIPLILNFLEIKTFLHLKLLTPGLFIFIYETVFELFISLLLSNSYNFIHVCTKTAITYFIFLVIHWLLPTSFKKLEIV